MRHTRTLQGTQHRRVLREEPRRVSSEARLCFSSPRHRDLCSGPSLWAQHGEKQAAPQIPSPSGLRDTAPFPGLWTPGAQPRLSGDGVPGRQQMTL